MNSYRTRVWSLLKPCIEAAGEPGRVLDFGCGDGWFASQVVAARLSKDLIPLDVIRRANVLVEPLIHSALEPLPFEDRTFDLTYAVDVLHHCHDPFQQLVELDRVTRRHLVIKDHTFRSATGRWTLAVMDELGNRKFGIPSPYHYQHGWAWTAHLQRLGWTLQTLFHPAPCHTGVLGMLTNPLQYVARYERLSG